MTIDVSRRSLLVGLGAGLVCAPAIVRASSLMKVKPLEAELSSIEGTWITEIEFDQASMVQWNSALARSFMQFKHITAARILNGEILLTPGTPLHTFRTP